MQSNNPKPGSDRIRIGLFRMDELRASRILRLRSAQTRRKGQRCEIVSNFARIKNARANAGGVPRIILAWSFSNAPCGQWNTICDRPQAIVADNEINASLEARYGEIILSLPSAGELFLL